MTARKIAALEALVERGATEGERVAARNALEKERAKLRAKEPPRPKTPSFSRPDWQRSDDAYAAFLNGLFARAQRPRRPGVRTYDIPPEPSAPRATQQRQATTTDFNNTLRAEGSEAADELLIEVTKAAQELYWRDTSGIGHLVAWRGLVWKASRFSGLRNDHSDGKHYLKVQRKDLRPVMVTV